MKFTNGFWMLRPEIKANYATEYYSSESDGKELKVFLPVTHMASRGNTISMPLLTLRLSSPMEDILKIRITHFEGMEDIGPHFELAESNPIVCLKEEDKYLSFTSGRLTARLSKVPGKWGMKFIGDEKCLTETGFRNMAHMHNTQTGKAT